MRWRLVLLVAILVTTVAVAGYVILEGYSVLDAIYMAVITLSTVGYGEVQPLSPTGKVFSIVLIMFGIGLVLYTISVMTSALIEGHLVEFMRGRRMDRKVEQLQNHAIVCGYGRVGQWAAQELARAGVPTLVIEQDEERRTHALEAGHVTVGGDATEDAVLQRAGIERARAVLCALREDADNVYLTLTARGLAAEVLIVARATDEATESKLRRAGADRVLSLYEIGGTRMAYLVQQPAVMDFLDVITHEADLDLRLEEVSIDPSSELVGRSLREARVREVSGTMVIAIRHHDGRVVVNPDPGARLEAGDALIVLGQEAQFERLHASSIGGPGRG